MKVLVVTGVVVVAIMAVFGGWLIMPVEIETGAITVCNDSHHEGDREISRDTEIKQVPRYQADDYQVIERQEVCASCQRKIDDEKREAERQARVAEVASSIMAGVCFSNVAPIVYNSYGEFSDSRPGNSVTSIEPGTRVGITVSAVNTTSQPINAGRIRLQISPPGSIEYDQGGPYGSSNRVDEWKKLVSEGLNVGELNPCTNSYYKPQTWRFPESYFGWHRTILSASASAGSNVSITAFLAVDGIEVELNTITIHVMHP